MVDFVWLPIDHPHIPKAGKSPLELHKELLSKSLISFRSLPKATKFFSTEFFYGCRFMRVCWIEIDAFFMRMIADNVALFVFRSA